VPGARVLMPAAFTAPTSVFMVVSSSESALMKWGCSRTWGYGRWLGYELCPGKGCCLLTPSHTSTHSPGPAGSVRSQWSFQLLLWLSAVAEDPHSGSGCARRRAGPLARKPVAGQAVSAGHSQKGSLQRSRTAGPGCPHPHSACPAGICRYGPG
jgi:hypothetical protein